MMLLQRVLIALFSLYSIGCGNWQDGSNTTLLSAEVFLEKISKNKDVQLVDVRTPWEFKNGYLENAMNIDWGGKDFQSQLATLDKSKPVFVYCLSGVRSAAAAEGMRRQGFQVYELHKGLLEWRLFNFPEVKGKTPANAMSLVQFQSLLQGDKLVLVDFYATWCAPCKKMEPYLEKMSKELADKLVLIRIDADENAALCKELEISSLPVLQLYKNNTMVWTHTGFVDEQTVREQLKKQDK